MNCCGNHSHGDQKNAPENNNLGNIEKKNSWTIWVVILLIILLIFSVAM